MTDPPNGTIRVDESTLHGEVVDGKLQLSFDVESLGKAASGSVSVQVLGVDNKDVLQDQPVSYDLAASKGATLHVTLSLDDAIEEQPDLVGFNVRVTDGETGGLRVTRSLLYVLEAYELVLEGPATAVRDKPATFRARTLDPISNKPLSGYP